MVQITNNKTKEVKDVLTTSASETDAYVSQNLDILQSNKAQSKAKKQQVTYSETKSSREKKHIPSASAALVMGAVLGILQTIVLISLAKPLLGIMGVGSVTTSPLSMHLTKRLF